MEKRLITGQRNGAICNPLPVAADWQQKMGRKEAIYEKPKQAGCRQKAGAGTEKVARKGCQSEETPRRSRTG
jgi:hypothetical protein